MKGKKYCIKWSSISPLKYIDLTFVFFLCAGKTSHAAAAPWEGINALDAAVACYNNVSMMRQQMKPSNRIHGIVIDGGEKPNIIPERSELSYYVRALTLTEASELSERVCNCAKGAAAAAGKICLFTDATESIYSHQT